MQHISAGLVVDLPDAIARTTSSFSEISWQDWLWTAAVLGVAAALGRILGGLTLRWIQRWSRRTKTAVDDVVVSRLGRPLRAVGPLLLVAIALPLAPVPSSIAGPLRHLVIVLAILGSGWVGLALLRVVEALVASRYDASAPDNLEARSMRTRVGALRNIAGFVVGVITVAGALMTFEAVRDLGAGLLASAGLAGVVLGFAAQRSIATVVAGIQIALAQPIRVDDVVIVEGEWGRIEEITLTYVVVKIWDLRRLVVPITYFLENPFENWTRVSADLLGTVELRLDYRVPVDAIREELDRILAQSEHWDQRTNVVQVVDASDRTMTVRPLVSAADAGALWNLRCEVREKLLAFVAQHYPDSLPRLRLNERHDRLAA